MKKCMKCGNPINKDIYDYCHICWLKLKEEEENNTPQESFQEDLKGVIYTTYIMFYEDKEKIGYTKDFNSRMMEIKREFPDNKLVYFREFIKESEARLFEGWLKSLTQRNLMKFISTFQDKIKKVDKII